MIHKRLASHGVFDTAEGRYASVERHSVWSSESFPRGFEALLEALFGQQTATVFRTSLGIRCVVARRLHGPGRGTWRTKSSLDTDAHTLYIYIPGKRGKRWEQGRLSLGDVGVKGLTAKSVPVDQEENRAFV